MSDNPIQIAENVFGGANSSLMTKIDDDGGNLSYELPESIITPQNIIPPAVMGVMAAQFAQVGLKFEFDKFGMHKDNTKLLKDVQQVAEMVSRNKELLPKFASAFKRIYKGLVAQGRFNADMATNALAAQTELDKSQAQIMMAMMGYSSNRNTINLKLEAAGKRFVEKNKAARDLTRHQAGETQRYIQARSTNLKNIAKRRADRQIAAANNHEVRQIKREDFRERVSNNSVPK